MFWEVPERMIFLRAKEGYYHVLDSERHPTLWEFKRFVSLNDNADASLTLRHNADIGGNHVTRILAYQPIIHVIKGCMSFDYSELPKTHGTLRNRWNGMKNCVQLLSDDETMPYTLSRLRIECRVEMNTIDRESICAVARHMQHFLLNSFTLMCPKTKLYQAHINRMVVRVENSGIITGRNEKRLSERTKKGITHFMNELGIFSRSMQPILMDLHFERDTDMYDWEMVEEDMPIGVMR
jgi:hypothetical protein